MFFALYIAISSDIDLIVMIYISEFSYHAWQPFVKIFRVRNIYDDCFHTTYCNEYKCKDVLLLVFKIPTILCCLLVIALYENLELNTKLN